MSMQDETDMVMEEALLATMELLNRESEESRAKQEQSPTLAAPDTARRPKIKTACKTCPNSMWFSSPEEVKCYCRIMHMISWSGKDSNLITMCDGNFLG